MAARWHAPLDPNCPIVEDFYCSLDDDPMSGSIPGDVLADISDDFERKHRAKCERCQQFGCANIEVGP